MILLLLLAAATVPRAAARVNATSALDVFLISDCNACTKDGDSIFCTAAASDRNFVANGSASMTIAQKKQLLGPSDGAKFCWAGARGRAARPRGKATRLSLR
jgi:hypothetical protein